MPSSPQAYLLRALSIIQEKSLKAKDLDWQTIKSKSLVLAKDATSSAQTYLAIRYALSQLGDKHSFLVTPSGRVWNDNTSLSPATARRTRKVRQAPISNNKNYRVGIITVPSFSSSTGRSVSLRYAATMRQNIEDLRQRGVTSWIVDLRGNIGGNMWPMLVGLGPLIGAGKLGSFESHRFSVPWFYEDGQAWIETPSSGKRIKLTVLDYVKDCKSYDPVAVLIDEHTASSAEAIAISFKGRPNTVFFGKHTRGLSTCNDEVRLNDGARIYLTIAIDADRDRNLYECGISPDFPVEVSEASAANDISYGPRL